MLFLSFNKNQKNPILLIKDMYKIIIIEKYKKGSFT